MGLLAGIVRRFAERGAGIPPDKKLSREASASLLIHSLFQFGASMSGLFLNLYLWRLTGSLFVSGMYNIVLYVVTPIAFALAGWLVKRTDRLIVYRLGILLIALFYLLVIVTQRDVVSYYMLFAIFNGAASAFYWTGYLTLMYDVSTDTNRIRYLGFNMMTFTAAGLAGPALAGFIISRNAGLNGYVVVFAVAFAMFVLAAVCSLLIKRTFNHRKSYYLRMMGLLMRKDGVWLRSLLAYFFYGLLQGIMLFLPNIMLYQVVPREDTVGYFGVLTSAVTIAVGYFLSRWGKEGRERVYLGISAGGYVAGAVLLFAAINLYTVIGFILLYAIFSPLQNNSATGYYYRLIGRLPLKGQLRVESIVMREAFVNTGRVAAIATLIALADGLHGGALPAIIIVCSALQFVLPALIRKEKSA